MGSFCPNHIKFELKKRTEELSLMTLKRVMQSLKKNWLPMWFQMYMRNFMYFYPTTQVWKFLFNGLFLSKVYKVWATKIHRGYLSWHWTMMQNLNKLWPCGFENGIREIGWTFIRALKKSLKSCTLIGCFCPKLMFLLEIFMGIMCHDTEGWWKI